MERTTKEERKNNARYLYNMLMKCGRVAVVVEKQESKTNPHINRCRLKAVISMDSKPCVIAESTDGLTGCFYEFLNSIKHLDKMTYFNEDGFYDFVAKNYGFEIDFFDGLVFIFCR